MGAASTVVESTEEATSAEAVPGGSVVAGSSVEMAAASKARRPRTS